MEPFDAIQEGVGPGGLRDKNSIRLLICYLLTQTGPVGRQIITDAILSKSLANYFEIAEAIGYLIRENRLERVPGQEAEVYAVTPSGAGIADDLEKQLPLSVREKVVTAAQRLMALSNIEKNTAVKIKELDTGGCMLTLVIKEKNDEMLNLSIYVGDILQAEGIRERFLENPARLYEAVISSLL